MRRHIVGYSVCQCPIKRMSGLNELIGRLNERQHKKVQVGKDQEKAQSEEDFPSKNRGGNNN